MSPETESRDRAERRQAPRRLERLSAGEKVRYDGGTARPVSHGHAGQFVEWSPSARRSSADSPCRASRCASRRPETLASSRAAPTLIRRTAW